MHRLRPRWRLRAVRAVSRHSGRGPSDPRRETHSPAGGGSMTTLFLTATLLVPANTQDLKAEAEARYRAGLEVRDDSAKARRHFTRSADLFEQIWESGERTPD